MVKESLKISEAINGRRTDNTTAKRRIDNTMAKRRTDNTMAKRTDNTMAKGRRTDNTMAKRKRTNNDICSQFYFLKRKRSNHSKH